MRKERKVRYFINMLDAVKSASTCTRRQIGAILTTNDNEIVTTGYNGTPSGVVNCDEGGCPRCNNATITSGVGYEYCLCVHGEHNAILSAAKQGKSVEDTVLYVSDRPCLQCLKVIIQCGIRELYYKKDSVFMNANPVEIRLLVGREISPDTYLRVISIYEVTDDEIKLSEDYYE